MASLNTRPSPPLVLGIEHLALAYFLKGKISCQHGRRAGGGEDHRGRWGRYELPSRSAPCSSLRPCSCSQLDVLPQSQQLRTHLHLPQPRVPHCTSTWSPMAWQSRSAVHCPPLALAPPLSLFPDEVASPDQCHFVMRSSQRFASLFYCRPLD